MQTSGLTRAAARILLFGDFALDPANRELSRNGERVVIGSRYFDALRLLADEAGQLVPKDRFMAEVWRGVPVTDEALTQCVRTLRRALGDEAGTPRFIETVPKHGYRFIAEVSELQVEPENAGRRRSASRTRSQRRLAGASAIGGAGAGALGGLAYGLLGTAAGMPSVPALAAAGAAVGMLGGAGVGAGMAAARVARADGTATIAGAAFGGLVAGALGGAMSRDGIALLTGARLGPVTGLLEGLLLGLAVGIAVTLAARFTHRRAATAVAAVCGAAAGALIALAGGRMLGSSLAEVQSRLPASQLALERIGAAFGENGFGPLARGLTSALEGATFVFGVVAAILFLPRR